MQMSIKRLRLYGVFPLLQVQRQSEDSFKSTASHQAIGSLSELVTPGLLMDPLRLEEDGLMTANEQRSSMDCRKNRLLSVTR